MEKEINSIFDVLESEENIFEKSHEPPIVLLVEDYEINAEIQKELLEYQGVRVDVAEDGFCAIDLCNKKKYDLIIMDINMPKMDGYETTVRLKKEGLNIETPVIAMTARVDEEIKKKCFESGMVDVLSKPMKSKQIEEFIAKWVFDEDIEISEVAEKVIDPSAPPINMEEALYEFNNDKEILKTVIFKFIEIAQKQIASIKENILKKEFFTIQKESHKLRGGSANLSINMLSCIAGKIEDFAILNDILEIEALVPELDKELERLKNYLDDMDVI